MRWRGERESENVEDRRDEGGGFGSFPGGGVGFPSGGSGRGGGIGILGILIILGLMFFFGVDPSVILQGGPPSGGSDPNFPDIQLPQSRPDTTNFPAPGDAGTADRASQDLQRGRSQAIRVGGPRRDRRCLEGHLRALWRALQRSQAGAVHRRRTLGLRLWARRRWGRSTAPTTRRSISTSASTRS